MLQARVVVVGILLRIEIVQRSLLLIGSLADQQGIHRIGFAVLLGLQA